MTIDFFALEKREHLREERASQIRRLWYDLLLMETFPATHPEWDGWRREARWLTSERAPHCCCMRAFHGLYLRDRAGAKRVYEAVDDYLQRRGM